jgi:hypothetical protein
MGAKDLGGNCQAIADFSAQEKSVIRSVLEGLFSNMTPNAGRQLQDRTVFQVAPKQAAFVNGSRISSTLL